VGARQNWLERNPALGAIIAAVISGGFFGFALPRALDRSAKDFTTNVAAVVDQKLKEHHIDELHSSVDQMAARLQDLDDNVKLLLTKEYQASGAAFTASITGPTTPGEQHLEPRETE